MTPYQIHETLNHHTTRHSPDGVQIIEECSECGQRWLHDPVLGYPVTLRLWGSEISEQRASAAKWQQWTKLND